MSQNAVISELSNEEVAQLERIKALTALAQITLDAAETEIGEQYDLLYAAGESLPECEYNRRLAHIERLSDALDAARGQIDAGLGALAAIVMRPAGV